MAFIMAQGGKILTRPTGGILATDCGGSTLCSPCIETPQDNAGLSVTGESCQIDPEFWPPGNLYWCENWPSGYSYGDYGGTCCWVWANHTNLDPPGFIFHYVLFVCYSAGQFDARILVGTNIVDDEGSHDPCDWFVGVPPAFSAADVALACGPDGKLHGTFTMTGQDPGFFCCDATGCTATVTL